MRFFHSISDDELLKHTIVLSILLFALGFVLGHVLR